MLTSLKVSAGFWFYTLALIMLAGIILVKRGILLFALPPILHSLDLPLLIAGMIYGGLGLYVSLSRDKTSIVLASIIGVILAVLLGFILYLNFGFVPRALI